MVFVLKRDPPPPNKTAVRIEIDVSEHVNRVMVHMRHPTWAGTDVTVNLTEREVDDFITALQYHKELAKV